MTNPFKSKLAKRQTASLVNADHASAGLVHFMGTLGIDAVMIDCEQGSPGFEDVENLSRAARLGGMAAIVRIPSPEPWTIERYMLRGIDGVVVPRLDTAAQVTRVLDDIRYCAPADFDEKTVIIQVESVSAVEQLDGFLAVPGIDCYFIGAVDLAKSMGFRGDYAEPAVLAVIDDAIKRMLDKDRCVGFLVKENDVAQWQAKGVTMLYTHLNEFAAMGSRRWRAIAGLGPC